MAEYHDLVGALTWLLVNKLQSQSEYTRGLLGNGQGQVQVPGRPDYTYVRPDRFTTRVFEVFNKMVSGPDGMPVILGELPWSPGLTQVLSVDWDTYLGVGWGDATPGITRHGQTHEHRDGAPGVDTFNVYRRQMGDLKLYPVGSGSMSIYVSAYNLTHMEEVKSWPGLPGMSLSGAVPATTGTARMALVYWDPCSGTTGWLGVATGTLGVDAATEILSRPAAPAGTIPVAYARLAGGQSTLTEFDIWDARPLWQPSLEFSTGSCSIWAGIIPIGDPGLHFTGSTVEAALDEMASAGGGAPSGPAGGDLTGTYPNPNVAAIWGYPLQSGAPAAGDIWMFSGTSWQHIPSPIGEWTDFTPAANQAADLSVTVNKARYRIAFGIAHVDVFLTATAAGTAGNAVEVTGISAAIRPTAAGFMLGIGGVTDTGVAAYSGFVYDLGGGVFRFLNPAANPPGYVGVAPGVTLGNGDTIAFNISYAL